MKKVRITKRHLGAYVRKILLESDLASGVIQLNPPHGIKGIQTSTSGGKEIINQRLANMILTMISRGDVGLMGNIFEDLSQALALPGIDGGSQNQYSNLNTSIVGMTNSPAADIGKDWGTTVNIAPLPAGKKKYEIGGTSWSVKSSAGASGGGFGTSATAVGWLGACGLHQSGQFTIGNINSQSEAYQKMGELLDVGDEVTYKMGLCYYTYNRSGQISLEPPDLGSSGEAVYVLNAPTTIVAQNPDASVQDTVCKKFDDPNSGALFNIKIPERLDLSSQQYAKRAAANVILNTKGPKACGTNTCAHVDSSGNFITDAAFAALINSKTQYTLSNGTKIKGRIRVNKPNFIPAQVVTITADAKSVHAAQAAQYAAAQQTLTNLGAPATPTGEPEYSQRPTLAVTSSPEEALSSYFSKSKDIVNFRARITSAIMQHVARIFSKRLIATDTNMQTMLDSAFPALNNPAAANNPVALTANQIYKIVVAAEGGDVLFFENALDAQMATGKAPTYLGLAKNEQFSTAIPTIKAAARVTPTSLKKVITGVINAARTSTPNYLSLQRVMIPVFDTDSSAAAFDFKYCDPSLNTFTIKRLNDFTTSSKSFYQFSIKSPDSANNADVIADKTGAGTPSLKTGQDSTVSHSTGWKTVPSQRPSQSITIAPASIGGELAVQDIVQAVTQELDVAISIQNAAVAALATPLSLPSSSFDTMMGQQIADTNPGMAQTDQDEIDRAKTASAIGGGPAGRTDSKVSTLAATIFIIAGERFTLPEAQRILNEISDNLADLQTAELNHDIPYPENTNNMQNMFNYLTQQQLRYSTLIQTTIKKYAGATRVPAGGSSSMDAELMHTRSVKFFYDSILTMGNYIQTLNPTTDREKIAAIRGSVSSVIRTVKITDDLTALAWLNDNGTNPPWDGTKFIYESSEQGTVEHDLTGVYLLGKSVVLGAAAHIQARIAGDAALTRKIKTHLDDLEQKLRTAVGKDVTNDASQFLDMFKNKQNVNVRPTFPSTPSAANRPFPEEERKIVSELRLYDAILRDLMEASAKKQRAANRPKKIKITKRQLQELMSRQLK